MICKPLDWKPVLKAVHSRPFSYPRFRDTLEEVFSITGLAGSVRIFEHYMWSLYDEVGMLRCISAQVSRRYSQFNWNCVRKWESLAIV
jgi:hypothetical protein